MKILITSATPFEIGPVLQYLDAHFVPGLQPDTYQRDALTISILITGVGLPQTAYQLTKVVTREPFDLVIQAGIAGAFGRQIPLGNVYQVVRESFADIGIEEADGSFHDLFSLGLWDPQRPPFQEGYLINQIGLENHFLPQATAISVNRVHGSSASIAKVQARYPDAQLESMEGAAFFWVCLQENLSFLSIRSVSNYVEPRNRDNWKIELAIENLNQVLIDMLQSWEEVLRQPKPAAQ